MNPLKIQDNTFRDGHQSIYATRMRTEDMIPIAEAMDEIGFWAMEVWGGATFDTMHRFLGEDPWERPRILKRYIKKTPFSMLLRGQNLVGYRHYADDVVRAFVDRACKVGIDIFRVFDALNDLRNIETCAACIKANGKHFEGAVVYSLTQRHLGGEVFNLSYYVSKAKGLEEMGADSICIKDMAGIMAPYDAYDLFTELKKAIKVPLHLHTHYTSGMGSMTCLKAVEAGVDIVDTCVAPYAMRTSMPPVEPLLLDPGRHRARPGVGDEPPAGDRQIPGIDRPPVSKAPGRKHPVAHRRERDRSPDPRRDDLQPRQPAQGDECPRSSPRSPAGNPSGSKRSGDAAARDPDFTDHRFAGRHECAYGEIPDRQQPVSRPVVRALWENARKYRSAGPRNGIARLRAGDLDHGPAREPSQTGNGSCPAQARRSGENGRGRFDVRALSDVRRAVPEMEVRS